MASGKAYNDVVPVGEAVIFALGTIANPTVLFGNPNLSGGLNDGLYGTTGPAIGISLNGVSAFEATTTGFGYVTGAGGTVTQLTDRTTGVTVNTRTGAITLISEALAAGAENTFTVTDSAVAATDAVIAHHASGGTSGAYDVAVSAVTGGTFDLTITNMSAGSLTEVPVIRFAIIKSVNT